MVLRAEEHVCRTEDGLSLTYRAAGEGPVVMLATGLGADASVWAPLVSHLSDRYRCVFWDYRGLHEGPAEPAAPDVHARDALAILDAEGVQQVAFVGWSMGAQVALELVRLAPARVAALVFINGASRTAWGHRPEAGLVARMLPRALALGERMPLAALGLGYWVASPEARSWAVRVGWLDARADQQALEAATRSLRALTASRFLPTLRMLVEHDATDVLSQLTIPILFIAGDRDPLCSRRTVERWVMQLPAAEYLPLPGGTHFVLLERSDHVALRVSKFLEERFPGAT